MLFFCHSQFRLAENTCSNGLNILSWVNCQLDSNLDHRFLLCWFEEDQVLTDDGFKAKTQVDDIVLIKSRAEFRQNGGMVRFEFLDERIQLLVFLDMGGQQRHLWPVVRRRHLDIPLRFAQPFEGLSNEINVLQFMRSRCCMNVKDAHKTTSRFEGHEVYRSSFPSICFK